MTKDEHIRAHDDVNRAFDSGSVFTDTTEDHERYLRSLGTVNIESNQVRTKAIVRALTINHIQMSRTISTLETTVTKLNSENDKVAKRVFWLTVVAVIFGSVQAFGVFWMICRG